MYLLGFIERIVLLINLFPIIDVKQPFLNLSSKAYYSSVFHLPFALGLQFHGLKFHATRILLLQPTNLTVLTQLHISTTMGSSQFKTGSLLFFSVVFSVVKAGVDQIRSDLHKLVPRTIFNESFIEDIKFRLIEEGLDTFKQDHVHVVGTMDDVMNRAVTGDNFGDL